ncbi:MAG: RHS repeat-associated core domain-containing protein [Bacteroidota bacterium]
MPFRFKVVLSPQPVDFLLPDILTPISAVGRIASAEADTVAVLKKESQLVGVNKFMRLWSHEYVLRDHLGGMRVRFRAGSQTASPTAVVYQYASYYPYGLEHGGQSYSRGDRDDELFHGKRLDEGHGLDWHHYGWRYYDAEVGRWTMVDPADEMMTAYSYVGADPINLTDPDGRVVVPRGTDKEIKRINYHLGQMKNSPSGLALYNKLNDSDMVFYFENATLDDRQGTMRPSFSATRDRVTQNYNRVEVRSVRILVDFDQVESRPDVTEEGAIAHEFRHGSDLLDDDLGFLQEVDMAFRMKTPWEYRPHEIRAEKSRRQVERELSIINARVEPLAPEEIER